MRVRVLNCWGTFGVYLTRSRESLVFCGCTRYLDRIDKEWSPASVVTHRYLRIDILSRLKT